MWVIATFYLCTLHMGCMSAVRDDGRPLMVTGTTEQECVEKNTATLLDLVRQHGDTPVSLVLTCEMVS